MNHGHGVIDKAIDLMDKNDRDEFRNYVNTKSYYKAEQNWNWTTQ